MGKNYFLWLFSFAWFICIPAKGIPVAHTNLTIVQADWDGHGNAHDHKIELPAEDDEAEYKVKQAEGVVFGIASLFFYPPTDAWFTQKSIPLPFSYNQVRKQPPKNKFLL
ncbi:hypothetical protein [Pedobacter rhizosphaerae]|uniref:Uncharacterized protein n=1 Tax=Pedobacter rhizosphaerae TaxID=390241 RepID=A0A1H9VBX8_9SPHI|nr:hypothetical protein [Pedobacter rhizosphaerae]SES18763.1 hypothetical protein SAMN04488023_14025 [Pedobacter rhizosphaerae]